MNYYNDRICINVLAGNLQNAKEIYEVAEKCVVVGVLSANYPDVNSAVEDMQKYAEALDGNLSVGLGGGNPTQWRAVAEIAKKVKANHFNQVFTAVGWTRANVGNNTSHINALVSPSGKLGYVKISVGELSKKEEPAIVPVKTAIAMVREMGGNSLKFFPMCGLKYQEELKIVAQACAETDFILEPTGGIDLENYEEILEIILNAGVKKIIPHVYSSIIDRESNCTRIEDVQKLMEITKRVIEKY